MRIAVIGSRTINDYDAVRSAMYASPWWDRRHEALNRFLARGEDGDPYTIVSGGADGVDTLAERFAEEKEMNLVVHEPDWDDWSEGHPAKARNTRIIEDADVVVAVWDGQSSGTRDSIDKALDMAKPLYVAVVD